MRQCGCFIDASIYHLVARTEAIAIGLKVVKKARNSGAPIVTVPRLATSFTARPPDPRFQTPPNAEGGASSSAS